MRRVAAAVPAVAITVGLFFLMQALISAGKADTRKPDAGSGVSLVTLLRDSASPAGEAKQRDPLPAMPAPVSQAPSLAPPVSARMAVPDEPDLTADVVLPETPVIDALPFLGGPPAVAKENPAVAEKSKVAKRSPTKKKPRKQQSRDSTRTAKNKSSSKKHTRSAASAAGKHRSGKVRGSGGKRGHGRRGKGGGSTGNSGVVVLSRAKPSYPRKALRNNEEGWVKVSFTITTKGTVANPKVVASKPRRVFDRSALQAIRKWRFKPKMVGGNPVRTRATQLIEFNLAHR